MSRDFDDYQDHDDVVYEDFDLYQCVQVEQGCVNVDLPGMDRNLNWTYETLCQVVFEPWRLRKYTKDKEVLDFWQGVLPEVLNIAQQKIQLYQSIEPLPGKSLKW